MSITDEQRENIQSGRTSPQSEFDLGASFPPDFLWGAATAAYQIEGAVQEDGRGKSIWDYFSALPGKTYRGETGEVAADHYHRMQEDVALMAQMGLKSYRFSIAWPRIQPTGTGSVNTAGLDFYDRLVDTLLAHDITPLATLYHWDLPLPLHERGGWTNRDTASAFADYAEIAARHLGDRVEHWLTHNEPWCTAFLGYGIGIHAPGIQDTQAAVNVAHHVMVSHGLALPRIRACTKPTTQLGIAINLYPVYGVDDHPDTLHAVKMMNDFKNGWFLDPIFKGQYPERLFENFQVSPPPILPGDMELISSPIDFLGINYYTRTLVRSYASGAPGCISDLQEVTSVPDSLYTAMNWEIYPQGLEDILRWVHTEYAPPAIMVTENGAAFDDQWNPDDKHIHDAQRVAYLREHIRAIERASISGAPMRGYFAWSLLDNYEWAEGYSKRFGLVYVDYPTQQRIVKDSGNWYAKFIQKQASRTNPTQE